MVRVAVLSWVLCGAWIATPAAAQIDAGYLIRASGCGPASTESTNVGTFVLRESGSGTVGPESTYSFCSSSVDAATGLLTAAATYGRLGANSFATLPSASARLQERIYIDGLGPGETAVIAASLPVDGGAQVTGSGSAQGFARLEISGCRVSTTLSDEGEPSFGSSECLFGAIVEPTSMSIRLEIPFGDLPGAPFNYVALDATVSGSIENLGAGGVATAEATAALFVETFGDQTFRFGNPETLTVPEPGTIALGLAAVAALRVRAGRRAS